MKRVLLMTMVLMAVLALGVVYSDECPMDGFYMSMDEEVLHDGNTEILDQTIYLRSDFYQGTVTVGIDVNRDNALTEDEISVYFAEYNPMYIIWSDGDLIMVFSFDENYGIYVLRIGGFESRWVIPMIFISR